MGECAAAFGSADIEIATLRTPYAQQGITSGFTGPVGSTENFPGADFGYAAIDHRS
jgi:hypothetical protein